MTDRTIKTQYFEYAQNNSGGGFDHDRNAGIGYRVIIEALNAGHADDIAEGIGIYFDGCDSGIDCDCCGDRWYRAWGNGEDGLREPSGGWDISSYVHFLDGIVAEYPDPKHIKETNDEDVE